MIRQKRMKLSDAYRTLMNVRAVVNPNVGFINQLIDFERSEFGFVTFDFGEYCIRELQNMYEESNTQATRKNCIKALEERPFSSDMGIVEAMVWLEDNCTLHKPWVVHSLGY
ncbi:hypothetical protein CYMTET_9984 [Cymbomonas tetramitiformis]|uniref:Uncharacterized protein n=1 Tax=Cymbomonas tetramitiformis TaxID=36881 RepID=A0AAE0GQG7_9CHLO|nr:hypothetical protein CYMTET_9984 [Cymbomonas tetramitiformis]